MHYVSSTYVLYIRYVYLYKHAPIGYTFPVDTDLVVVPVHLQAVWQDRLVANLYKQSKPLPTGVV